MCADYYYSGDNLTREVRTTNEYDGNSNNYYTTKEQFEYVYDSQGLAYIIYEVLSSDKGLNVNVGEEYTFAVERNLQGDVMGLWYLSSSGSYSEIIEYTYTAYGAPSVYYTGSDLGDHMANANKMLYRGYYYDDEIGMYYLQSRFYDPEIGRFLSGDSYVSTGQGTTGFNMFAYCLNDPISFTDSTGSRPIIGTNASTETATERAASFEYISSVTTLLSPDVNINFSDSSHEENRRPNSGEPGSTYVAPNGDIRVYGPDGRPAYDYDHDDHGQPDKHPHDENGGHSHDWDWNNTDKPRGDAYASILNKICGVTLVATCTIGVIYITANDVTGIGVGDDMLIAPFSTGISHGLSMIFG